MSMAEHVRRPIGLVLHPAHADELERVRRDRGLALPPLAWVKLDPTQKVWGIPVRGGVWAKRRAVWCDRRRLETEAAVRAACDRLRADGIAPRPSIVGRMIGKHVDYTSRVMRRLGLWCAPKRIDHKRELPAALRI